MFKFTVSIMMIVVAPVLQAADRPKFQAPFECAQQWDASTYCNDEKCHWPDPDSIDLAQRNAQNTIISKGQPVLASAAGKVSKDEVKSNGERWVFIDHGGGWVTHNIHLEIEDAPPLKIGRKIARGEMIGRTSNSGAVHVHQHYSQVLNGEAKRIKFNTKAISTHAGNKDSYGTWGKNTAEKITSLNCSGGQFMPWRNGGKLYYLRYNPSKGEAQVLEHDTNSQGASKTWSGNYGKTWTSFIPFYSPSNHPHAITYSSATGKVWFLRFGLNGGGSTNLKSLNWYKGWTDFAPFYIAGKPHFVAYDSRYGYLNIDRIHQTSDGSTAVLKTKEAKGWTSITPLTFGPSRYLLFYKAGTGKFKLMKINSANGNVSLSKVWSKNGLKGWSHLVPVSDGGSSYLFAYKQHSGKAKVWRFNSSTKEMKTVKNLNMQQGWTSITPYRQDSKGHLLLYKTGSGKVKTIKLKNNGNGISQVWSGSWTRGWR